MRTLNQHRRRNELEQYAARNRAQLTESEAKLWEALRAGRLGIRFRRQVVLLDRYIVDFYAPSLRLLVEVDGGYHRLRTSRMHDEIASCAVRATLSYACARSPD
jgi:very-short-patch-repair endonuclease